MDAATALQMYEALVESDFNYMRAARLYAERHPDVHHPSRQAFRRLHERRRTQETLQYAKRNRNKSATGEAQTVAVLASIEVDPHLSTRPLAHDAGVSQSSVRKILKENGMKPYKLSEHQELQEQDLQARLRFCAWAQGKLEEDPTFFKKVLFTDESTFMNRGHMNKQNRRYWAAENPHWMREIPHQHRWKLNVWCGVVGDRLIGPHFFYGTLRHPMYNDFLRNILPNLLGDVPQEIRDNMWWQQDGAPPHRALANVALLHDMFPAKWVGMNGPVGWPARSPDLTPLDFFLWGRLKEIVYATAPTTAADMRQRIEDACRRITVQELRNVQNSFNRRIQMCMNVGGGHFEHLLN